MTTCKKGRLTTVFFFAVSLCWSQTLPSSANWALGQFAGPEEWGLPGALVFQKAWADNDVHTLSPVESDFLRSDYEKQTKLTDTRTQTVADLKRDRSRLSGTASSSAEDKAVTSTKSLEIPTTLPLKRLDPTDPRQVVWPPSSGAQLAVDSGANFAVTGSVRVIGPILEVSIELYSAWESQVISRWSGQCSPNDLSQTIDAAADALRSAILGRKWSKMLVQGGTKGQQVRWNGASYALPWESGILSPGPQKVSWKDAKGTQNEQILELPENQRLSWTLPASDPTNAFVEIRSDPPGALLYIDSQYLGPAPQQITVPRATSRVRAEIPGGGEKAIEIGPQSSGTLTIVVPPVQEPANVELAKDRFYWSLAAFSAGLTTSAFLSAWATEQANLAVYYSAYGVATGYAEALGLYHLGVGLYAGGVVLTSGLFVWMMVELGNYLTSAESSLP